MAQVKFVYFDLGGVMFYWQPALIKIAEITGADIHTVRKIHEKVDERACLGELSVQQIWDEYQKELSFDGSQINFGELWVNSFVPIPEVHDLARHLLYLKYEIGILSNYFKELYPKSKGKCLPDLNYAAEIISADYGLVKPNLEIYEIATKKSGVNKSEIFFIDDNLENIYSSIRYGWEGYVFDNADPKKSVIEIKNILNIN